MGRKKAFDKKSSITFKLVHRSQRDPLAADESAPQMVFVDTNDDNHRKDEQKKYGIYFDDEYNYLQHLRDVEPSNDWEPIEDNKPTKDKPEKSDHKNVIQLPSSMFASAVEEKEGLLNKAVLPVGPQLDWDPDIVEAMEEDFDFNDPNNQIDDDFVLQAEEEDSKEADNKSDKSDENDWEDVSDSEDSDENVSTVCGSEQSLDGLHQFSDEETKSHFTNYSMSSSVMRRNKNLSLLDQRFETLYETEYSNDCDIGALDLEDIEGSIDPNNSQLMASLVEEYQTSKQKQNYEKIDSKEFYEFFKKRDKHLKESEELTEIEIFENSKNPENDGFDCESIISTFSNLYNRPKLIKEISKKFPQRVRINDKTGLPIGVLQRPGLTAKKLAKLDASNDTETDLLRNGSKSVVSNTSRLSQLSVRQTYETPEQRKQRKSALKEYRRERRVEKKANTQAFKSENIRLNKEVIDLQKNLNSVKLV